MGRIFQTVEILKELPLTSYDTHLMKSLFGKDAACIFGFAPLPRDNHHRRKKNSSFVGKEEKFKSSALLPSTEIY